MKLFFICLYLTSASFFSDFSSFIRTLLALHQTATLRHDELGQVCLPLQAV
jgi:hypothetical protein